MNGVSEWIVYLWLTPALLVIVLPLALLCFRVFLYSTMFLLRLLVFGKRYSPISHERSDTVAPATGA